MIDSSRPAGSVPRVLHVVDSLERGGLERVVVDLALAQRVRGCEVRVFSIKPPGALAQELTRGGVGLLLGNKRKAADPGTLLALRRAMADLRPGVVHAHDFMPSYYAATASLGLRGAPALVVTCHNMGTRLAQPKLRWIMRWALGRAARVAMVGDQVYKRYVNGRMVAAIKSRSVRNGIVVDHFVSDELARARARHRLGVDPQAQVIGCVGRLVDVKNHRLVIGLLPRLVARFPRLHLVIVGEGVLRKSLEEQILREGMQSRVSLVGEQSDVPGLLPGFDIFAMPSITEGLSIALLEAAATGLPIVATAVGGNPEIIEHARNGLLVPVNDAQALARALASLLEAPQFAAALGCAARAWVDAHASVDAMERTYAQLYLEALGERNLGDDVVGMRTL